MEELNLVFSKFGFNLNVKTVLISFLEREVSQLTTGLFEELKNPLQLTSKDSNEILKITQQSNGEENGLKMKENIQKQILHFLFLFLSFLQQQIENRLTKANQQLQSQVTHCPSNYVLDNKKIELSEMETLFSKEEIMEGEKRVSKRSRKEMEENNKELSNKIDMDLESIFFQIPVPLWNSIFEEVDDKKTLKNLRLTCKKFRNLSSPFWIQYIPSTYLSSYLNQIKKFNFELQTLKIIELSADIFQNLPSSVTKLSLQNHILEKNTLKSIPSSITDLDLEECHNVSELNFGDLHSSIRKICLYGTLPALEAEIDEDTFKKQLDLCFDLEKVNVNVDIETDHYYTGSLLHLAFNYYETSKTISKIQLLLKNGADINKSTYGHHSWTPLILACKNGYLEIVELLLKNGADINQSDRDGWTPLLGASQNGHLEIVKLLLKNGADVNFVTTGLLTHLEPRFVMRKITAIYIAWSKQNNEIVELLSAISSKQLNVQLANENGDEEAKKFFSQL